MLLESEVGTVAPPVTVTDIPNTAVTWIPTTLETIFTRKYGSAEAKYQCKARSFWESSRMTSKVGNAEIESGKSSVLPPTFSSVDTYADSGATAHFFCSSSAFVPNTLTGIPTKTIKLGDHTTLTATQQEEAILSFSYVNLKVWDVLFVPTIEYSFVSVDWLADNSTLSLFCDPYISLQHKHGFEVGCGTRHHRHRLQTLPYPVNHSYSSMMLSASVERSSPLSQRRLAHISGQNLQMIHEHVDMAPNIKRMEEICRSCQLGGAHKLPFLGKSERAKNVGDIVYTYLTGPLVPSYPNRLRYASWFFDDFSPYAVLEFGIHRSELMNCSWVWRRSSNSFEKRIAHLITALW